MNRPNLVHPGQPERELRDGVSLKSVLAVLARRPRHFWLPALLLTLAGVAVAVLLPSTYLAYALLAIEPATPGEDSEPAALTAEQQLARISEIVNDRALLEKLAKEHALFPKSGGRLDERQLLELRRRVSTRTAGPSTFTIGFEDRDPARAARVAGRLADLLVELHRADREGRARETAGVIEDQLVDLRQEIAQQERRIESYKQTWFAELPEQVPGAMGQLERADRRLQEVEAAIAEAGVRMSTIRRELEGLDRQGYAKDPAETRLDQLELELANLRRRYTPRHPDVVRLESEVEELAAAIRSGRAASVASAQPASPAQLRRVQLAGELDAAQSRLAASEAERRMLLSERSGLARRMASAPTHEAALAEMSRGYDGAKAQHEARLRQLAEARMTQRLEEARRGIYRVVEAPRVPESPESPNRLRIILLGLLAGLGAGFGVALLAEQSDTSFRDIEDFRAPSSLPVLAAIPWQSTRPKLLAPGGDGAAAAISMLDEPFGVVSEQYRILAAKLVGRAAERSTAILLTSSQAGEGKSTAAVNLALAMSRMVTEESVLLVDADPGRPAIHRLLGLSPGPGLAALLANPDVDPSHFIRLHHGMFVLDAGEFTARSRDALCSPVAERVFQRLRRRFSCLVIDGPPVLAVAEGMLLQKLVDSTVLVVRARVTPREWLRRAMENLDYSRLAGVLLTDVEDRGFAYPYANPTPDASPRRIVRDTQVTA